MTCGDNNLRVDIQDTIRSVLNSLEDAGTLLYAYDDVKIVYETEVGGDSALGKPSTKIQDIQTLRPQPKVDIDINFFAGKLIQKTGTAVLTNLPVSDDVNNKYTQKDIESASHFLINGIEYDIVGGGLQKNKSGMFWIVNLKKRITGGRLR